MAGEDAQPRRMPPGSCSWCGHPPHGGECPKTIKTGTKTSGPCPCQRRAL